LITGAEVFDAPTLPALLVAQASERPVPPSQRTGVAIPLELEALVLNCLAKDPGQRIQSVQEIVARLDRIEIREPWTQERAKGWWSEVAASSFTHRASSSPGRVSFMNDAANEKNVRAFGGGKNADGCDKLDTYPL
jgi:serine/threonine-protein kinase